MKPFQLPAWGLRVAKFGGALLLLALVLQLVAPGNLFERLGAFPLWATGSILLLLVANLLLVSFRFWRVLAHFGIHMPWATASRASIAGHVSGLFVISLFGQVAGRQTVLERWGVPALVNASLAIYERGLLALTSGLLCAIGGVFLLGQATVAEFVSAVSLLEIFVAGTLAMILSYVLGGSDFETKILGRLGTKQNIGRVIETVGITLAGQALVLMCFIVGIHAVAPQVSIPEMLASATIISFVASIPITINGWGVRELASIFVLGQLGVPAADAVTVSVVVGLCSTLVILFFIPVSLKKDRSNTVTQQTAPLMQDFSETERIAAWFLGMAVAVAVFFQAHVSLQGGIVNINLADPLAILALAAIAMRVVLSAQMPAWRVPYFNLALLLISLVLCTGFIRGWLEIGVTQWALGGRLIGWLVLMGYLSAGYILVSYFGPLGLRRFTETIAVTAVVVVIFSGILRMAGVNVAPNFEGYAGNRNAFAFQLLTAITFLLVYSATYARKLRRGLPTQGGRMLILLLAIMLAGLSWTGSRAGWIAGGLVLLVSWQRRYADRRLLSWGVMLGALLWVVIWGLHQFEMMPAIAPVQSVVSSEHSDQLRWQSYSRAFALWQEYPILGAGLGTFFARSSQWLGAPLVIHSTPLWILTEFGIVGFAILGGMFVGLARYAIRARPAIPTDHVLILTLLVFAAFGLVHEVYYQRVFWLALGVLLAKNTTWARSGHSRP